MCDCRTESVITNEEWGTSYIKAVFCSEPDKEIKEYHAKYQKMINEKLDIINEIETGKLIKINKEEI